MSASSLRRPFASALLVGAFVVPSVAQQTQTLPLPGMESVEGNHHTNIPFASTGLPNQTWDFAYSGSQFATQSAVLISGLAFRANDGGAVPAFDYPSVEIRMGYASAPQGQLTGDFALTFAPGSVLVRPAAPWTGGPIAGNPGGVSPFFAIDLAVPFAYDPTVGDLAIRVEQCGVTTPFGTFLDVEVGAPGSRYGDYLACQAPLSLFTQVGVSPVIRLTFGEICPPIPGVWQTNSPAATLTPDGTTGTDGLLLRPACKSVGGVMQLHAATTFGTQPFDVALWVGAPYQGVVTGGGQIFHAPIWSPNDVLWLIGGTAPNIAYPFDAFAGLFPLTFTVPAPLQLSAQMAVFNTGHADGFTVSAPVTLVVY